VFPTWAQWNEPWNAGSSTLLQPKIIAGNQQGFVVFRETGTSESNSLYIQNISGGTITCPDHCLNEGDYFTISGNLGTSSILNGQIFSVGASPTQNTFVTNPVIASGLTYLGSGLIKRMYVPFIQTRQFPMAWDSGRKTRIGVQQYLLTRTPKSQITLLIFLSQDASTSWNSGNILPGANVQNDGLVYSTVLYTCPESTNLGLTPFNTNLQQLTTLSSGGTSANNQAQIWHRINTSLLGDTVQLGLTMSDAQMRDTLFTNQFEEIELHGIVIDAYPSQVLS
jgi:hypothetical protein